MFAPQTLIIMPSPLIHKAGSKKDVIWRLLGFTMKRRCHGESTLYSIFPDSRYVARFYITVTSLLKLAFIMNVFNNTSLGMLPSPSLDGEMTAKNHRAVLCIGCVAFSVCSKFIPCFFGSVSLAPCSYLDLDMGDMSIYS